MRNIPQGDIWSTSSAISNTFRQFKGIGGCVELPLEREVLSKIKRNN